MKNIHLLPTQKPSRLGYLTKKGKEIFKDLRLFDKPMPNILDSENQNIYITDDSEIKEGDWVLNLQGNIGFKASKSEAYDIKNSDAKYYEHCKKIILTTDQDLIADGVQAIDEEFLEWFVKNPSCEFVEIKKGFEDGTAWGYNFLDYKIIIPQEEEAKQETLEEAAEKFYPPKTTDLICSPKLVRDAFIAGANYQAERMYSEEDMLDFAEYCLNNVDAFSTFKDLLEQFKKK